MEKKREKSEPRPVGELLDESMGNGFFGLAREMVRVFEVWPKAVGEFNAARTRPESIHNGVLSVAVEGSVWIDRFSYFKADFVDKINHEVGAPVVKDIRFRVGELGTPRQWAEAREAQRTGRPAPSESDRPGIREALAAVKDEELRKSLAALLARQRRD